MNIKHYILDDDNKPVPVDWLTWGMWFETVGNRVVDYTEITSAVHVSTIFLGLDHRHFGEGPPILFETMIFGGPLDQHMWRYASWDDAITGHKAAVSKVRSKMKERA